MFVLLVLLTAAAVTPTAFASSVISTSAATGIKLGVNSKGQAILTYTQRGKVVHVLAYGAVNAIAPVAGGKQVAFTLDYSGGQTLFNDQIKTATGQLRKDQAALHTAQAAAQKQGVKYTPAVTAASAAIQKDYKSIQDLHNQANNYFSTFTCPAYKGPQLAWFTVGCTAPDGSFWAVQEWDRELPDYDATPSGTQGDMEIHLSHWTGALPALTVNTDWSYHGRFQHIFGTFTYDGTGVYGFKSTPGGAPLDTFGRNLYLDAYNSDYGSGWVRVNSWLTHKPGGSWCYGLYPHGSGNDTGDGLKYRLTIIGPGVTPDIMSEFTPPDDTNKTADATAIQALNDPQCGVH